MSEYISSHLQAYKDAGWLADGLANNRYVSGVGTNLLSTIIAGAYECGIRDFDTKTAYETMGKLFEKVSKDSLELSIIERIWGTLQELIIAIANLFGLADEDIYDVMINRSEEMNHICNIYKLKLAS